LKGLIGVMGVIVMIVVVVVVVVIVMVVMIVIPGLIRDPCLRRDDNNASLGTTWCEINQLQKKLARNLVVL
jgi:uncharacterized membrane protein